MTPRRDNNFWLEVVKIVLPVVLAAIMAAIVSRAEAQERVRTEVAVLKAVQDAHFQEIQRVLARIEAWMARQEEKGRQP